MYLIYIQASDNNEFDKTNMAREGNFSQALSGSEFVVS